MDRDLRGEYLESLPGRGKQAAEAGTWGAESHPEAAVARRGAEIDCGGYITPASQEDSVRTAVLRKRSQWKSQSLQ